MRMPPGHLNDATELQAASSTWSLGARRLVSLALAVHLVGLIVGPISSPPSILGDYLQGIYLPYLDAAYLNHGYKFFGPDPGPSHLVRYVIEMPDGERLKATFPDRGHHWPRLLYHRYFMLSEFVASLAGPWNERFDWEHQPLSEAQRAYVESYARHLLRKYGGKRVTLELVEHRLPSPHEVLAGMRLGDPQLYRSRKLGSFES